MAFNNYTSSANVQYQSRNINFSKSGNYGTYYNGEWNQTNGVYQSNSYLMPADLPGAQRSQTSIQNGQGRMGSSFFLENGIAAKRTSGLRNPAAGGSFSWQQPFNTFQPVRHTTRSQLRNNNPMSATSQHSINISNDSMWNPDYRKHQSTSSNIQFLKPNLKPQTPQMRPSAIGEITDKIKVTSIDGVTDANQPINSSPSLNGHTVGQANGHHSKDYTWMLQKPGMVFGSNTLKDKPGKQVKAERKNSNMEPKAWLYAWLGFRHIRPEYSHQSVGQRPDQHFKCTLKVEGYNKEAFGQATSKKEAQTEAAWDFIEFLNDNGDLTQSEIEHMSLMRKKCRGEKGSLRDSINSTNENSKDENVKLDREDKIVIELESQRQNETWVKPNPAWLRGEQQVTAMDDFWRQKDMSLTGNCSGGPAVTGGHGLKPKSFEPDNQMQESGSPLILTPYPPPFDPTVPPPPLPPQTATIKVASQQANEMYKNPPPVIYYPPADVSHPILSQYTSVTSAMENTLEKTQTASNIRDMLDDITKELEEGSSFLDHVPRRNADLEPLDYDVLNFCHLISMKETTYSALCKVRNIVEQSLRQLSHCLVREECESIGREDLVNFVDTKLLKNDKIKILKRNPSIERDEEVKKEINKLRIVRKVIRIGNVAMDILADGEKVTELVLFTENIPTKSLLHQIIKLLPNCIDKSLNLGVELQDETIAIEGELLNEQIKVVIRLTSEKLLEINNNQEPDIDTCGDELSLDGMLADLQYVRRVDWWTKIGLATYPIMDQIASLFIWLRNEPNGKPLLCLDQWQLLLIIFFSIGSTDTSRLSPSDAVMRIFEALSSPLLSTQIRDPSEQQPVSFLRNINPQEAEDLANWAGKCLRLTAFDQLDEVFQIDINNNYNMYTLDDLVN